MIELSSINHKIQKHILDLLKHQEIVRFRDLRPPKTDTNLFSYHLGVLLKLGFVQKVEGGYSLAGPGLSYIDQMESNEGPKIIIMFLIQNTDGDVLLEQKLKQPYIDRWTLPYGKVQSDDSSLTEAAQRVLSEKLGLKNQELTHAGDCYIRVKEGEVTVTTTLVHLFSFNQDDIKTTDTIVWARPHKLSQYRLAPAVEAIVARGFFRDPFFFEEYESNWYN